MRNRLNVMPDAVPVAPSWPSNPPVSLPIDPKPGAPLGSFDAVVMTYTSAEAAALAAILTPNHPPEDWYEYTNGLDAILKLVTSKQSPILDDSPDNARYYHVLALFMACQIGSARVLLMKSGLHPAYDGPKLALATLVQQISVQTGCKVFITTGTAGGIGADTKLGDVNIATSVQFNCTTEYAKEPWAHQSFPCSPLPSGFAIPQELLNLNAAKLPGSPTPRVWTDGSVTTDCFAFDDSTDHYGLQNHGWRMCEMDDAPVAMGLLMPKPPLVYVVRNASDPQIPNPDNDIEAAKRQGEQIYQKYGGLTTASSVIACKSIIDAIFNGE